MTQISKLSMLQLKKHRYSPRKSCDQPQQVCVYMHKYINVNTHVLCCSQSFSHVQLFATSWTVAHQAPLFMGILQARILEQVAIPSSRGSFQHRDPTQVSCIADSLPAKLLGKPLTTVSKYTNTFLKDS